MWAPSARMPSSDILKIALIGSGGVASSLAPVLDALEGVTVAQVMSRTAANALALASRLANAEAITTPSALTPDADIYIIAVTDNALAGLAQTLPPARNAIWLHTSGSVDASVLSRLSPHHGVLYPLQTFSKGRRVDMARVPLFIEGSDALTSATVEKLARRLTPDVYEADSSTRRLIHVAAVFSCNFANHLWATASDILATRGIPFTVMRPLLEETLGKALRGNPADGQTGPARRGDTKVIAAHREMLSGLPAEIYDLLTQSIIQRYDSLRPH